MARVVVVGAGLGGLACAARLAALGHRVTVCEQSAHVGGKLGWFARDGFAFDTGPEPADAARGLPRPVPADRRRRSRPRSTLVPVDPVCTTGSPTAPSSTCPTRSRSAIARRWTRPSGAGAGADWAALHGPGRRGSGTPPADRSWSHRWTGPRTCSREPRGLPTCATVAPWRSLRGLGRRYLRDPHLRTLLDRYATYTGSDPRRAPAALATVPYVEQTFGAWYVRGGLRRLGRRPARSAPSSAGRRPHSRPAVDASPARGRPGQRGPAGRRRAPARRRRRVRRRRRARLYADLLPRSRPRRARAALAPGDAVAVRLRPAAGPARSHPRAGAPHRAVPRRLRRRVRLGLRLRAARARPRRSPTRRSTSARPTTPRCARTTTTRPGSCWSTRRGTTPADRAAGIDWDAPGCATAYADHLLDVMAPRGLDVRDRLLWREIRTPADLERATGSVGGSIYGTSQQRRPGRLPAAGQPRPGARAVPGRRLGAPRRRAAAGRPLRRHRGRPDRAGLSASRRTAYTTSSWVSPTRPRVVQAATPAVPQPPAADGYSPAPSRNMAVTITRVGRSDTVTTPTSGIPATAARARAYSCSQASAPAAAASHQLPPASARARRRRRPRSGRTASRARSPSASSGR